MLESPKEKVNTVQMQTDSEMSKKLTQYSQLENQGLTMILPERRIQTPIDKLLKLNSTLNTEEISEISLVWSKKTKQSEVHMLKTDFNNLRKIENNTMLITSDIILEVSQRKTWVQLEARVWVTQVNSTVLKFTIS